MAGGFGQQGFGAYSFGFGGPLAVVRALAVAGQVVRVVFTEEPLHRSPAGVSDALNPSNYILSVPGGNATSPVPVGIDTAMVTGPAYGVGNGSGASGERAFDVHVDRQLIVGVVYRITVRDIRSLAGGALGSPTAGDFQGVTRIQDSRVPARNQDLVDLANPPTQGHYHVDVSGDLAVGTPAEGTVCRVYRRLTTRKGAFRFMPGYGVAIDHKSVASIANLSGLKTAAGSQIREEPDVASASVTVSVQGSGLTLIQTRVKTRRGDFVDIGAKVSAVGDTTLA